MTMQADSWNDYELLDFGGGRKLERWGTLCVDRPSPAAEAARPAHRSLWSQADGRFDRTTGEKGRWRWRKRPPETWRLTFDRLVFEVAPTPFGHLGLFPEQARNWRWLLAQNSAALRPLRILNLFAYTGGSTLAAAGPEHEVVHVDASKSSVAKARQNAKLSGLEPLTIRWIVEDVLKFCQREVRRENTYDAIILDPPTYGHGPKGERWQIDEDLPTLLDLCSKLWRGKRGFVLMTCHSETIDLDGAKERVELLLNRARSDRVDTPVEVGAMNLTTSDKHHLDSGLFARWSSEALPSC